MRNTHPNLIARATALGSNLPPLNIKANRLPTSLLTGNHALRRAGPGDNFWSFRPYQPGDESSKIDWRKSARSAQVFIKEHEWNANNCLWLWAKNDAGMQFKSENADESKAQSAQTIALTMATLALNAHELVGTIVSQRKPRIGAETLPLIAHELANLTVDNWQHGQIKSGTVLLISDFLEDITVTQAILRSFAQRKIRLHVVQVTDPAEESLPYAGRVKFHAGPSQFVAESAESLRVDYKAAFTQHRKNLRNLAQLYGASFIHHQTSMPLLPTLLKLHHMLGVQ